MKDAVDPRQAYWNEDYVRYWAQRVEESNASRSQADSSGNAGDSPASSDRNYLDAIALLDIRRDDTVLELGCGFGRSLPVLGALAGKVHGLDISPAMIEAARKSLAGPGNVELHVGIGERTPFADAMFDVIVCFAVFDAMYQAQALIELNRTGKPNCRLLLTGKNDNYFADDEQAEYAELRAREKGHPNYFTDTRLLLARLSDFGFAVSQQRFYPRRGDFHEQKYATTPPEFFYEYMLVLKKTAPAATEIAISDPYSKTWRRKHASGK